MKRSRSKTEKREIINVRYRTSNRFFIRNLISFEVYTESERVAIAIENTKRFLALVFALLIGFVFYVLISNRYSIEYREKLSVKPSLDRELKELLKEEATK